MDPTLGPAAVRAAGNVASSFVNRYRPVGVVRVGSAEDRAAAYRRFLDGASQVSLQSSWYNKMHHDGGPAADALLVELVPRIVASATELHCAHAGLLLCAPAYVIEAAEIVMRESPQIYAGKDKFKAAEEKFEAAIRDFLEVARHDLSYNPKSWQFWAKWKEKSFRKREERKAIPAQKS
ncbi:hypothetical protein PV350_41250 [Streptomyces sp. PA03-6a]|nr:hypothetical protein [Streptomyces sp. PA03-6a]